jgi:hypothetical protein
MRQQMMSKRSKKVVAVDTHVAAIVAATVRELKRHGLLRVTRHRALTPVLQYDRTRDMSARLDEEDLG